MNISRGWRMTCIWMMGLAFAGGSALHAQGLRISVSNPSPVSRLNEPIILRWADLIRQAPEVSPGTLGLVDEQQKPCVIQVDDLDLDGTPDEVTFAADFGPRQRRTFSLVTMEAVPAQKPKAATDAADWKRVKGVLQSLDDDNVAGNERIRGSYRFDGVGWESEIAAYRLYLDERNAVDILGKRIRGLYWQQIGSTDMDYQQDAHWGMDVLHVGAALGIGGIGFWSGDSVLKPITLDRQRTRIIARGPVRALVRVAYSGWEVGNRKMDVTSLFSIYVGDRTCEQRVFVSNVVPGSILATGIVRHDSTTVLWNGKEGWLCTSGLQSRAGDSLLLALNVSPSDLVKKMEGRDDRLLLLKCHDSKPIRILISYYWQGETGRMWTQRQTKEYLNRIARRITEPLVVRVGRTRIHESRPTKR